MFAQTPATQTNSVLIAAEGRVEVAHGAGVWVAGQVNDLLRSGDRLRTGARSRATVRLSDLSVLRVDELTTIEIRPPRASAAAGSFEQRSGATYFFNRERPTEVQFRTPVASGAIRGTEFNLRVGDNGRTEVTLLDGIVDLNNQSGSVTLTNGEQGIVEPGQAPRKTAVLNAMAAMQWALYYPAILDVDEAGLTTDEQNAVAPSIEAYRAGDLLGAEARYPAGYVPQSDAARIYRAATLLAVGQVPQAEATLGGANTPLAEALRELIAVVTRRLYTRSTSPSLATEWMAESYLLQSQSRLEAALDAANHAIARAPRFGFAWVRAADLEFGFGHIGAAHRALEKGMALSPRNAEALAVSGFLFAAENKLDAAARAFDDAITIDPALGNAWLGRGLVKVRRGHAR